MVASNADCRGAPSGSVDPALIRRLWWVLGLTATFMVVEAAGGWAAGSLALLADAGHMLTDVGALGLSLLTAWIAHRPANDVKTFGYRRWEILAALVNGTALFGIAGWVVLEALHRLHEPPAVRTGLFLGVALAGLVVNLVSLRILHGTHRHNLNTRGAYLHIMGDLLGSLGAIGAAVVIATTGWRMADPLISIAISLLILVGAFRLLRESTDILLEGVPKNVSIPEVQRRMLGIGGVTAVHDLHVWTVTSGMVAMSGHAVVPDLGAHPGVLEGIRAEMAGLGIGHVTIQLEVEDECEPAPTPAGLTHGHAHLHPHPHPVRSEK
jgi:cobalt-zinc-cadmium efflux system protein